MKKTVLVLISLCAFSLYCAAQNNEDLKHDYVWLTGYSSQTMDTTFGGSVIDFNFSPPDIFYQFRDMNLDIANASMCDPEGNLLFYSNGTFIDNAEGNLMLNGDNINPDPYSQSWKDRGLPLYQGLLPLPLPNDKDVYILFHEERNEFADFVDSLFYISLVPTFYYSVIDMNLDNGLGEVVQKNQIIISDTMDIGKITATRHANGRDWWILVPEFGSNKYYRTLLDPQGVHPPEEQLIGEKMLSGLGQAHFSPDGSKYARINGISAEIGAFLDIFDFDRCSGELSNPYRIFYQSSFGAQGLAFSPNARFLYVSASDYVFQYDTQASDIAASIDTVAIYDGFLSPLPTGFFLAQLGPDNKIYINCPASVNVLHVIHNPDEKGEACNFEQHGLTLPTLNAFSLPNFPNYRLGALEGSPCDSIISTVKNLERKKLSFQLFPNPAKDQFSVQIDQWPFPNPAAQLQIFDITGRLIEDFSLAMHPPFEQTFSVPKLKPGMYWVKISTANKMVQSRKLVITN